MKNKDRDIKRTILGISVPIILLIVLIVIIWLFISSKSNDVSKANQFYDALMDCVYEKCSSYDKGVEGVLKSYTYNEESKTAQMCAYINDEICLVNIETKQSGDDKVIDWFISKKYESGVNITSSISKDYEVKYIEKEITSAKYKIEGAENLFSSGVAKENDSYYSYTNIDISTNENIDNSVKYYVSKTSHPVIYQMFKMMLND